MALQPQQLLLLPRRLELAAEFVKDVTASASSHGVLLSGPNGVGKSGVGLLSYLLCAARRMPVVYLGKMETWVQAAQSGGGDAYLLGYFWKQNVDLIAASPLLRGVFAAPLRDDADAFTPRTMAALRDAAARPDVGMGVILDEVQHITAAVQRGATPGVSTPGLITSGSYFSLNWHDWMNDNRVFARMSIASAHGERDYRLPSGEDHRVRIVEPLSDAQRSAMLSHQKSPAYVRDAAARERIVFYAGNILRSLMDVARNLPDGERALKSELAVRLDGVHAAMEIDCKRWLASLPGEERAAAAIQTKDLLAGKLSWRSAKGLYDAGIMFRTARSAFIRPVSPIASAAYLSATASYFLDSAAATPLSSITDGRLRGLALEARVLARVSAARVYVGAKSLDGRLSDGLFLRSSYSLPFDALDDVVQREVPVLYQPLSLIYPCDGILMPAEGDAEGSIIVIECSITDPRDADRVAKVLKYFEPSGVISELARRFPALPRVIALVYDSDLATKTLSSAAAALSRGERFPAAAVTAPEALAPDARESAAPTPAASLASVRVLDRASLVTLSSIVL